jgi:hypothetical protein
MLSKKRIAEKSRGQSGGGLRRCVVPKDCTRRHETPKVQGLPSLPFNSKFQDALCKTGECIGKCSSEIVRRGRDDIQTCRRASAPLSKYSEVWTFPICLITYSTMVIAWASELAGALLVWILKVSDLRATLLSALCAPQHCSLHFRRCANASREIKVVQQILQV